MARTRLRYNGLRAAVGSGGWTSSATSVTFGAALTYNNGVSVPTLAGTDYIPLAVLDSSGHLSEVVWLTAYTSGSTSGTISRGMEGTSGVAHSSGDTVVCSILAVDVSTWTPNVSDPLSSMTNLATPASGTWSIVSGVLNQSSSAASEGRVLWGTDTQVASGSNAVEVEVRQSGAGGSGRIGFYIGAISSGSPTGYALVYLSGSGTSWVMTEERQGTAVVYTSGTLTKTANAWMRLSVMTTPSALNMYLDGTFIGSTSVSGAGTIGTRIGLYTYQMAADFRNLKSWDSLLNPPAPF